MGGGEPLVAKEELGGGEGSIRLDFYEVGRDCLRLEV